MTERETRASMEGKVCVVTGGTAGIGLATASALARRGGTVVVVGRDPARGAAAVDSIRQKHHGAQVEFIQADLTVQAQVRRLAKEIEERHPRLDVLVNNAGGFFAKRRTTADGIEMTLALNHLAPFLLTNLLRGPLEAAAPSRVVNVSSDVHKNARVDPDNLQMDRWYVGFVAYGQAKLALVLFTYELARRLAGSGVTANALNPGLVATDMWLRGGRLFELLAPLIRRMTVSPEDGAATSIYLASSPEVARVTGRYFAGKRAVSSARASYDEDVARRLWKASEELTSS